MTRFNIRKRDGLARTGIFETDKKVSLKLPAAADIEALFPDLAGMANTNLPLSAPIALVKHFPPQEGKLPVIIHPQLDSTAASGDCVMPMGWQTAFANPRTYVDWLVQLKEKTPVDTAWYAPAAALPSTIAILCYSGFDLFDFKGVDLRSAQGLFCTPEGD
jgi:archaeosine synthase